MTPLKFYILLAVSIVGLALTVTVIVLGQGNDKMQLALQTKQQDIGKGSMSQQIGSNLLRDIAQAAVNDSKLRDVLTKNGFALRSGTDSASAPAASAAASPKP